MPEHSRSPPPGWVPRCIRWGITVLLCRHFFNPTQRPTRSKGLFSLIQLLVVSGVSGVSAFLKINGNNHECTPSDGDPIGSHPFFPRFSKMATHPTQPDTRLGSLGKSLLEGDTHPVKADTTPTRRIRAGIAATTGRPVRCRLPATRLGRGRAMPTSGSVPPIRHGTVGAAGTPIHAVA